MSVNEKMTSIANKIREKTGETNKLNLDQIAISVDKVFDSGKQTEYDAFWDGYQNNGNRTDYSYAFYGSGWNEITYKPKYPIIAEAASYGYANSNIVEIDKVDVSGVKNLYALFSTSRLLQRINKLKVTDGVTNCLNMFRNCEALTDVTFEGSWNLTGLNLQWSKNLTRESILSLIHILSDVSGADGSYEVCVGDVNLKKLTDEDLQIAINKGWVIC